MLGEDGALYRDDDALGEGDGDALCEDDTPGADDTLGALSAAGTASKRQTQERERFGSGPRALGGHQPRAGEYQHRSHAAS